MDKFSRLIKGQKVAVVGPSPHLAGLGLGKKIDSYDLVCRMNEVRPVGLEEDYGSHADMLFWHLNNCDIESDFMPQYNADPETFKKIKLLVYPRQANDVNRRGCGHSTPLQNAARFPKVPFYQVDTNKVKAWENEYSAHFTVGALTLLMILECDFDELFICGFSFFKNGGPYWHKAHATRPNSLKYPGHDIPKEIRCLRNKFRDQKNVDGDYMFKEVILG